MTVAERIARIRLMERMEEAYRNNNERIIKDEDGTLKYVNEKGEVLIEARLRFKEV